jgi:ABC-type antimicrobial peptide transport system permease subunit
VILKNLSNLDNVAVMNPLHALALILISVALTVLGGTIPARLASKRDPVEALRSE